jgi:8-oxo-dGTP pyrophosphatase MutT (NUDIX family)
MNRLRKKDEDKVASIAVFNKDGKLLFGKRRDNSKWTNPGGHFEPGESPEHAARRELKEEAGYSVKHLTFLGEGLAGRNNNKRIYAFSCVVDGSPDASEDPDEEIDEWKWVDVSDGLPKEITEKLHSPKNVTLRLLGLQEGPLEKSLKEKFVALAAAGAMSTAAMAQNPGHNPETAYNAPHAAQWTPKGLADDLHPIAHLESSFGKRLEHLPHSKGEYHSAFGAVGMKPVTAHETYKRSQALQKLYPGLGEEHAFIREFKTSPAFYNTVATTHWNQLKRLTNGDPIKAAYAWRWGSGKLARTPPDLIQSDPYTQAYAKLSGRLSQQPISKSYFDSAIEEWLSKSSAAPKHYWKAKDGLRIPVRDSPDRIDWDRRYKDVLKSSFDGYELQPVQIEVTKLSGLNGICNKPRLALYTKMAKSGDPLPPIVIQRSGNGYNVIDGNHRLQAANDTGLTLLDAFEIKRPDQVNTKEGSYKLYDLATDDFNLFQPVIRQTQYGQFYEPVDLDGVKAKLKELGFQGYRGASQDPLTYVYFDAPTPSAE